MYALKHRILIDANASFYFCKEAAAVIEQKTANLEELKAQKEKSAAEFNARISVLKEYKAMLERA